MNIRINITLTTDVKINIKKNKHNKITNPRKQYR